MKQTAALLQAIRGVVELGGVEGDLLISEAAEPGELHLELGLLHLHSAAS